MEKELIESKIIEIEKQLNNLKVAPTQAVLDKTMNTVIQKLDDRDKIIDLELKNMSQTIKLDIHSALSNAHIELEKKLDQKIREAISQQNDKVSWGIEIVRFFIVAAMFILSIKLMPK